MRVAALEQGGPGAGVDGAELQEVREMVQRVQEEAQEQRALHDELTELVKELDDQWDAAGDVLDEAFEFGGSTASTGKRWNRAQAWAGHMSFKSLTGGWDSHSNSRRHWLQPRWKGARRG